MARRCPVRHWRLATIASAHYKTAPLSRFHGQDAKRQSVTVRLASQLTILAILRSLSQLAYRAAAPSIISPSYLSLPSLSFPPSLPLLYFDSSFLARFPWPLRQSCASLCGSSPLGIILNLRLARQLHLLALVLPQTTIDNFSKVTCHPTAPPLQNPSWASPLSSSPQPNLPV